MNSPELVKYDLRPLQLSDLIEFKRLRLQLIRSDPYSFGLAAFSDSGPQFKGSEDPLLQHLRDVQQSGHYFGFYLNSGTQLVGVVAIARYDNVLQGHKARLWGLGVSSGYRGRGIGQALMKVAIQYARSVAGVRKIVLEVSSRSAAARRLYQRLGFVDIGFEGQALIIRGKDVDEYRMELLLPENS